jgi:hypothetical protein
VRGNPALMFVGGAGAGSPHRAVLRALGGRLHPGHWDQPGGGYTGGAPSSYAALAAQLRGRSAKG